MMTILTRTGQPRISSINYCICPIKHNRLIQVGSKVNKLFSGTSEILKPSESISERIDNAWRYSLLIGDYDVDELYEKAKVNRIYDQ